MPFVVCASFDFELVKFESSYFVVKNNQTAIHQLLVLYLDSRGISQIKVVFVKYKNHPRIALLIH